MKYKIYNINKIVKMNKDLTVKDSLLIFERPLEIQSKFIYGLTYNREEEKINAENGKGLSVFIGYLTAADQWEMNGGRIEKNAWVGPGKGLRFCEDAGLVLLVSILMDGALKYIRIERDEPLDIHEGELDKDDPFLVISPDLILRYLPDTK